MPGTRATADETATRTGSVGDFFEQALSHFGDPDVTIPNKGRRLAKFVRQQQTLFILDGLEPLQQPLAQHRPALGRQPMAAQQPALVQQFTLAQHCAFPVFPPQPFQHRQRQHQVRQWPGMAAVVARQRLHQLGVIKEPVRWLTDPNLAMPSIIIFSVWGGVGGCMIIYLAALQAIPEEMYDAAKVDGAGPIRMLFSITIPLLGPATFYLLITSIIGAIQVFGPVYLLTSGGPAGRTTTIAYHLYTIAFKNFEMGYAAALSYVLFAIIFVFTLLYTRFAYRDINY